MYVKLLSSNEIINANVINTMRIRLEVYHETCFTIVLISHNSNSNIQLI